MLNQILYPMEPVSAEQPFDDPSYLYQLKWDGVRSLAFVDSDKLKLQTRRGFDHTRKFPELSHLPSLCRAQNCILDGELVVLRNNRPSFELILKREQAQNPNRIHAYSKKIPVTYVVFDIVYLNNRPIDQLALEHRQDILQKTVIPTEHIHLAESFQSGTVLYKAVCQQGLEGIVAKQRLSRYIFGGKHPSWVKIKCWKTQLCVVGGLSYKDGQLKSILLGAYREHDLVYLGNASSGLTERDKQILHQFAQEHQQKQTPFINPPSPARRKLVWLPPLITLIAEYLELTPEKLMRSPRIVGFSTESPLNCRIGASKNDDPYY